MQKYKNMTSGYFPEVMFLFLIFVFVRKNFPGNIHGPSFALFKGSSYIFTDNSDAEQLHTAQKQNQNDYGCVSGDVNTGNELLQQYNKQIKKCRYRGEATQEGGNPQRLGGIPHNAVNGIVEELEEVPFADSGHALTGYIGNKAGVVAHPGENALGEPMILSKRQNTLRHTSAEGTEVTGVRLQTHIG